MVALDPARLLLVVITDTGRVEQRIVELGNPLDEHQLGQLREMLGGALDGKRLAAASVAVADLAGSSTGPAAWAMPSAVRPRCCWKPWSSTARSAC